MSTYESKYKAGHPVAGIVLAVLGIGIAVLLTLLFGVIAGAVALGLGVTAVLLGVSARKGSRRGTGAIVTGAVAVILAVFMSLTSVAGMKLMHQVALDTGKAPVFAQCFDNPYTGLAGVVIKAANDPDKINELNREMDALREYSQNRTANAQAPKSDAPAEI